LRFLRSASLFQQKAQRKFVSARSHFNAHKPPTPKKKSEISLIEENNVKKAWELKILKAPT